MQKKKRRRGSKEVEPCVLAPLATEDPIDQLDGVQEENEEEEEEEMMKISPRSDSPRGQLANLAYAALAVAVIVPVRVLAVDLALAVTVVIVVVLVVAAAVTLVSICSSHLHYSRINCHLWGC